MIFIRCHYSIQTMKSMSRLIAMAVSMSMACIFSLVILSTPQNFTPVFAQSNAMTTNNTVQTVNPMDQIVSEGALARDAFHIFTSEIESVDENRLKISGDTYTQRTIAAKDRMLVCTFTIWMM